MNEKRVLEILLAIVNCENRIKSLTCKDCPLLLECGDNGYVHPWTDEEEMEVYMALRMRYETVKKMEMPIDPAEIADMPEPTAREIGWREFTLRGAHNAVCTDRNMQYGEPEKSFTAIGLMWTAYLHAKGFLPPDIEITDEDAALMLAVFKVARHVTARNPKPDTFADIAGYAACACECAMIADGSRAVIVEDWTGEEKIETRKG